MLDSDVVRISSPSLQNDRASRDRNAALSRDRLHFKEGIGEARGVKALLRKVRDGLLDLNGVQTLFALPGA